MQEVFKGIGHLKHFYCSNLIFWIVRCGIGHAESTIADAGSVWVLWSREISAEPEYQNCNSWHWHIGSGLLTVHRENGALLKFYPIITKKMLDLVFAGSITNVTGVSRVFRAVLQISSLTQISSKIELSKYFANEQISSKIYFSSKSQVRLCFQANLK